MQAVPLPDDEPGPPPPKGSPPDTAPPGAARSTPAPLTPLALRPVPSLSAIPSKVCSDGHPNDPDASLCRLCQEDLGVATLVQDVPPEPLGRLLLEDGSGVELVDDLVVGRHPERPDPNPGPGPQPSAALPAASPPSTPQPPASDRVDLAVDSEPLTVSGRQVSRRHFAIEVRGWRLHIRDLGSTNGTFVTRRGERGRRRIPEDRSIELWVGDTIHFGERQALVVAIRP
jgi:hypothetical protein